VREIAAVKGIGVLWPGAGTLRGIFSTTDANGQRKLGRVSHDRPRSAHIRCILTREEGYREMPVLDWSQCSAVESVPGKVSGAWVLRGTRMPVATIFENLEAGANIENIMEWYGGLDREQVQAVIEFAARSLDMAAPER